MKMLLETYFDETITLYHGTCPGNAENLLKHGWKPRSGQIGASMGSTNFLYVTNFPENAEWFANEKGCDTVLKVEVPKSFLGVDPEDGIGETVEEELGKSKETGMPAYLVIKKSILSTAFEIYK